MAPAPALVNLPVINVGGVSNGGPAGGQVAGQVAGQVGGQVGGQPGGPAGGQAQRHTPWLRLGLTQMSKVQANYQQNSCDRTSTQLCSVGEYVLPDIWYR